MGDELVLVRRFQFCNSWIVSTLASCGRLPVTVPDLANRPQQLVFLTPIDSQLNDFLNEIHQIACFEPSIVEHIDEDLDLHAKKKYSKEGCARTNWHAGALENIVAWRRIGIDLQFCGASSPSHPN
jgi:hypothetical protein